MAATDDGASRWSPLVAAALALPGVASAQTEPGPGPAVLGFKWLSYRDRQPGLDRIRVNAPSLLVRAPFGERWGAEAVLTQDNVSGASPRWHSAISGASRMSDERHGAELKVTRHGDRHTLSLSGASSSENDYRSRALAVNATLASDDNNRSWNLGLALTRDRIGSTDDPQLDQRRRTVEATFGVTQALSRADIVQLGLTHARGRGYYDDPYKRIDLRPGSRHQTIGVLRWNHHFEGADVTLRTSVRSYKDSFGVRSHTLGLEPVISVGERFSVTPTLRLYTQSAARFYYDPVYSFVGAPVPVGFFESRPEFLSPDARLAAFGAVTWGVKVAARIGEAWTLDLRVERYEQRSAWRAGGPGSPGLAPLTARLVQWGLARQF